MCKGKPMANPWLRLWAEFASDPKIQILAFEDQRHYVMVLCLKCNGTLDAGAPSESYRERLIAKALGLDTIAALEAKRRLVEGGLLAGDWQPLRWDERQYTSDHSSAERKRKQRDRDRSQSCHSHVTVMSRDSHGLEQNRTEQIQNQNQNRTYSERPLETVSEKHKAGIALKSIRDHLGMK